MGANGYTTEQRRAHDRARYYAKRDFLRRIKAERGCRECGERDPIVLDFHHRDPRTKHEKLRLKGRTGMPRNLYNLGWSALEEEIEKCDVLCANCHRREEHSRRQER